MSLNMKFFSDSVGNIYVSTKDMQLAVMQDLSVDPRTEEDKAINRYILGLKDRIQNFTEGAEIPSIYDKKLANLKK